jgi:hypothetical protein
MSETFWVALFAALPPTILAFATLVAVLKSNGDIKTLSNLVDGKFTEMLNAVSRSSKIEGKVEVLQEQQRTASHAPSTTVITDRRVSQ